MKLNAIIIDDEFYGRNVLKQFVAGYCPHLCVTNCFDSAPGARVYLENYPVDVVFLDIHMPGENGFDFLASLSGHDFLLVFVTAYEEYALRAIKASAVDYLLKPFKPSELMQAEQKVLQHYREKEQSRLYANNHSPVKVLMENLHDQTAVPRKIILYHTKGFDVVEVERIIRMQADGNYTTFYLRDAKPVVVSRPIREFEEMLEAGSFLRVHRSHLVNLDYLEQYIFDNTGYLSLSGGHRVEISRRRIPVLMEKLRMFSLNTRRKERQVPLSS